MSTTMDEVKESLKKLTKNQERAIRELSDAQKKSEEAQKQSLLNLEKIKLPRCL